MKNFSKTKSGFTVLEMLFYISIFVILSLAVINALITMTKAFRENTIQADIISSGAVMERITREIKQADSVSSISSSLLRLNTTDEAAVAKTVQFSLSGANIVLVENDVTTGNLNSPNTSVSSLVFTQITTAQGIAIKVSLSVTSLRDAQARVYDFYDTVVMRGSY